MADIGIANYKPEPMGCNQTLPARSPREALTPAQMRRSAELARAGVDVGSRGLFN
jgi:hypothetical protein